MGSWSLCTEEQFYLVTPLLTLFGAFRGWPIQRYGMILWAALAMLPIIRAMTWWAVTVDLRSHDSQLFATFLYRPFHTYADGLVVGLLISYYRQAKDYRPNSGFLVSGAGVLTAAVLFAIGHMIQREAFDFLGVALIFGAMIQCCLSTKSRWLAMFNVPVFYVISRLSYGMYLNHEYFQDRIALATCAWLPFLNQRPATQEICGASFLVLSASALSLLTYCLIEHPFLQLRDVVLAREASASGVASSSVPNQDDRPDVVL